MKEKRIQIEYNADQKTERKVVKNKKTGRKEHKSITLKDPKCWQIVTVKNHNTLMPGSWLTRNQLDILIKSTKTDVEIGMPGQFRVNSRGY